MKVATSIVTGKQASPELVTLAVQQAMQKAGITVASSVLLILTSEFSADTKAAIKAAAKAANCMLVMGCTASGIFTEDDWVLDAPAVAVMVFSGEVSLQPSSHRHKHQPLFTLTAPNAIDSAWLNDGNIRFGGVSGDALGQGDFSVWKNANGVTSSTLINNRAEAFFSGVKVAIKASHGLHMINQAKLITQVDGFDVVRLNNTSPLTSLNKAWNGQNKSSETLPLHLLTAIYADNTEAMVNGNYQLTNIVAYDALSGSITLAQPLKAGQLLCWGLRDKTAAEADMLLTTHQLQQELGGKANFGLLFSNLARGPYLYDGVDRDLKTITQQLPNMPLIGFYGNATIAPLNSDNQLLSNSAVLCLFAELGKEVDIDLCETTGT
jgi:small ligand-binding sensory domain FIST